MNKTVLAIIMVLLVAAGVGYVTNRADVRPTATQALPSATSTVTSSTSTTSATTTGSTSISVTPGTPATPTSPKPANPREPVIDMSGQIPVAVGRSGRVGDFTLKLNSMVQDNRCPVDVQCIEAGAVTVSVTVQRDGIVETRTIASDEVPHRFGKYRVSIIKVAPEARSTVRIPANGYTVTFYVELHE